VTGEVLYRGVGRQCWVVTMCVMSASVVWSDGVACCKVAQKYYAHRRPEGVCSTTPATRSEICRRIRISRRSRIFFLVVTWILAGWEMLSRCQRCPGSQEVVVLSWDHVKSSLDLTDTVNDVDAVGNE